MAKKEMYIDINDAISMASDEVVIKTYEGFETIDPIGKGFFTITNRRFIYYSTSRDKESDSVAVNECPIDMIGAINSEYGKRMKKVQNVIGTLILVFGLGGIGLGVYGLIVHHNLFKWIGLIAGGVFFVVGLMLLIFCKRKMFSLEICYRTPKTSMLSFTSDFFQSPNKGRVKIVPTNSTGQMIKELGKFVIEAQNYKKNHSI